MVMLGPFLHLTKMGKPKERFVVGKQIRSVTVAEGCCDWPGTLNLEDVTDGTAVTETDQIGNRSL